MKWRRSISGSRAVFRRGVLLGLVLTTAASLFGSVRDSAAPFDQAYADELLRYIYRWHMDDAILADTLLDADEIVVYYRSVEPEVRDAQDRSKYLEVAMPFARLMVHLKKADYVIPELSIEVVGEHYKFLSAHHYPDLDLDDSLYETMRFPLKELFARLHETRNDGVFPSEASRKRLRAEALEEMEAAGYMDDLQNTDRTQITYIAPISIVSNELWCYWVNGRKFIHFTSDLDIEHPKFWDLAEVGVEIIDLDSQIVVTGVEQAGQNYFTKDYVGRILFNCIIHGQQLRREGDDLHIE
ncbi:hypothetical protein [Coraliomargarita akajimensis]|uniref:Uncharacterized protein n=1 Tax=Coraliomargarita akajimensis (strain DSM 45221 / IAM 15411 / JCM 23193 / KCTC 12865 / 04OKA010-24) TaxID=583355 RepID=D5EPS1_CORAD|nr:hypothetical protein [Coraliomargarita akajimensis]ADE55654.1 hypothetical protein Caka_2638 [Coraliomargarita akajimensis DSM 45221]